MRSRNAWTLPWVVAVTACAAACNGGGAARASAPPTSATAADGAPASPAPNTGAPAVIAAPPAAPPRDDVARSLAAPIGSPVSVVGLFAGWRGSCRGGGPTRSAWMLVDADQPESACLYVDGPPLAGENPASPQRPLRRVRVEGTLREDAGTRYIEAKRVEAP